MVDENHIAFTQGILDPNAHGHFVKGLDKYSEIAGIPKRYIYESAKGRISEREHKWLRDYSKKKNETRGLVYVGTFKEPVIDRINVITGLFMRHFLDARVRMLNDITDDLKSGDFPNYEVLSIPNFFTIGNDVGAKMFDYELGNLFGMLMRRANEGNCTILYIQDYTKFEKTFGETFSQYLQKFTFIDQADLNSDINVTGKKE